MNAILVDVFCKVMSLPNSRLDNPITRQTPPPQKKKNRSLFLSYIVYSKSVQGLTVHHEILLSHFHGIQGRGAN